MADFLRRRRFDLLGLLAGLLLAAGLTILLIDQPPARFAIPQRYITNLMAGRGFAYNPGDPVLLNAASPPFVFVVALMARFSEALPTAAMIVGGIGLGLGVLGLWGAYLAEPDRPGLPATLVTLMWLGLPLTWNTLGIETPLWLGLCLLAVWAHVAGKPALAFPLLALAMLVRPETALLLAVLVIDSVIVGQKVSMLAIGIGIGIVALGLLWGQVTFSAGGPLAGMGVIRPADPDILTGGWLSGLEATLTALLALSPLWIAAALLALVGAFFLPGNGNRAGLILVGWAGLHVLVLGVLNVPFSAWLLAPLGAALAVLMAAAVEGVARLLPDSAGVWGTAGAVVIGVGLVAVPAVPTLLVAGEPDRGGAPLLMALPSEAAAAAGRWIESSTPPDATVGVMALDALGTETSRGLLAYSGALQPDLRAAYQRGDGSWWLSERVPDVLVLPDGIDLNGYAPAGDDWFNATYRAVQVVQGDPTLTIYQRTADPAPLTDHLVNLIRFPSGPTLNRISTDFELDPLTTDGSTGRMRIEWVIEGEVQPTAYAGVRIIHRDGTVASIATRPLAIEGWPRRELITTYHTVPLPATAPAGLYEVQVGLGVDPFMLDWQAVTNAKLPFEQTVFLGALSGLQADFGEIEASGYRIARTEAGIEVLLMWEANGPPTVDYRVFVQLRDAAGAVIETVVMEPYDGAYPTSIWSAGEQVAETYILNGGLPPGTYQVYIGLLDPADERVLTLDGRDAVLVAPLAISE